VALVIYVTTFHVDQSTARFAVSDGVSLYENAKEGVKLRMPGVWEKLDDSASLFVQLQSPDKSISVVFGTFPRIPVLMTVARLSLGMGCSICFGITCRERRRTVIIGAAFS
jgi:hypothetical protein